LVFVLVRALCAVRAAVVRARVFLCWCFVVVVAGAGGGGLGGWLALLVAFLGVAGTRKLLTITRHHEQGVAD